MTNLKKRLARHFAVATVATAAVTAADAAVVYSGVVNHYIPSDAGGLYLNVVTGEINRVNDYAVDGWDINLWSPTGLSLYGNMAHFDGGIAVEEPGMAANLGAGHAVDADQVFGYGFDYYESQWNLNGEDNLFGFRFHHEGTGETHYGWGRLGFGNTVNDRYLVEYAYESRPGVGIAAGSLVPAPSALAMLGLGGVVAGRRRR